jgi:uncharacterized membrane protein
MGRALLLGWICASGRMAMISIKKEAGKVGECPSHPQGLPPFTQIGSGPFWASRFRYQPESLLRQDRCDSAKIIVPEPQKLVSGRETTTHTFPNQVPAYG